jgi:RNA polymerase sigma-70 factor (ECF subfamily)
MKENTFIPTRRSLLSRLKDWGNDDSWREFFNTYWRLIYDFARKAGLNEAQAEDIVQETVISVANQMPGFQYDPANGSFKSWLMQVTRRRIADHLRKHYRSGDQAAVHIDAGDAAAEEVSGVADASSAALDSLWEEQWREHVRGAAIERVKRRVRPEQFQMFEFAIMKGWPARKVADALGVTLTQVYMARHRVGRLVRKEVQQLEQRMI